MAYIEKIILNLRDLILVFTFALYTFRFFKRDSLFKLLCFYLLISLFKLLPATSIDLLLYWFLLIQIVILTAFYYISFVTKAQKRATLFMFLVVFSSSLFLKFKEINGVDINLISVAYTYIVVFLFTIIHFYNQMDSFNSYKYFNIGMFLFLFLTLVSVMIIEMLFLFTEKKYINKKGFTIVSTLFDMVLLAFLIKQWLILENPNKTKTIQEY